jgi:hypothetical protein
MREGEMTRYDWYKRFSGTAFDPKFKAAAILARSERCRALAVWDAALELTSENEDRGSVRNIDLLVLAAGLDLVIDEVKRIWDAFVTLGMISLGRIANWAKRQGAGVAKVAKPPTAHALRQRRYVRRRAEDDRRSAFAFTEPAKPAGVTAGVTQGTPVAEGVTEGVTVTPELESDDIENKGGTPLYPPLAGGEDAMRPRLLIDNSGGKDGRGPRGSRLPIDWQPDPEDWVFATHLGLDPDDTAAEFRDYWCPKSRARSLDWSAEWRTHCRRKCERQRPRPGRRSPTRPSMTPPLRLALEWSARSVWPAENRSISIPNREWQPPLADAELLDQAHAAIGRLEDYQAPINPVRLSLRISTLLRQYWVSEEEQHADELSMQLWLDTLGYFPEWAVAEAIVEWFGNRHGKPKGVDIAELCRASIASASVELHSLRRLVNPWEQEQARLRHKEAEAERQRAAEREAFNAANPSWTVGLPQQAPRERPMEPEPFDKERYRKVLAQLKNFRLPDPDDPRVLERMRRAEEEAEVDMKRRSDREQPDKRQRARRHRVRRDHA